MLFPCWSRRVLRAGAAPEEPRKSVQLSTKAAWVRKTTRISSDLRVSWWNRNTGGEVSSHRCEAPTDRPGHKARSLQAVWKVHNRQELPSSGSSRCLPWLSKAHSPDHACISVWPSACHFGHFGHFCTALKILTSKLHLPASSTWPPIRDQCEDTLIMAWSHLLIYNGWHLTQLACPKPRIPCLHGIQSHCFLRLAGRLRQWY